jgi:hypothetical protein
MRTLHLAVGAENYTLTWKDQNVVVSEVTFAKNEADSSKRELKDRIASEWRERGNHRNVDDLKTDLLILHTDNRTPYGEIAEVMARLRRPSERCAWGRKPRWSRHSRPHFL